MERKGRPDNKGEGGTGQKSGVEISLPLLDYFIRTYSSTRLLVLSVTLKACDMSHSCDMNPWFIPLTTPRKGSSPKERPRMIQGEIEKEQSCGVCFSCRSYSQLEAPPIEK